MSAGIYNSEAKKNYIRYCMEYQTAWIQYLPQIAEAARKFNGKKITKRISNAIEKIDSRLSFDFKRWLDKAEFTAFWRDWDARIFTDEVTGEWNYVRDQDQCIKAFGDLDSFECFNAEQFIEGLEKDAAYSLKRKEEVFAALENLDELKAEYNEALAAFKAARDKIPYDIKDFYKVDTGWINDWR